MKKLFTALLICTMTISLFGCEDENRTNVSRETTVAETTAEPKPEPEYITTNEYYSDLLSEEDVKVLKENIVTMDVLEKAIGEIQLYPDDLSEENIPSTIETRKMRTGWVDNKGWYKCQKYGDLYITMTSFYSTETDRYVEYIYKCEYVDGVDYMGEYEYDVRVPLFYKRIAPPSGSNFENRKMVHDASEQLDKYFTEEEIEFLRENVNTVDTLEQVFGRFTYIGDFASGHVYEQYECEKFPYEWMCVGETRAIELEDGNYINDIKVISIIDEDENATIGLYLP